MGVVIFLLLAAAVLVGMVLFVAGGSRSVQRQTMAKAPETTAALFDGRRQVSYTRSILNGLPDDVLLAAAEEAGYELTTRDTAQYETTLTFTKR